MADIVVQFLINVIEMSIQLSTTQRIHNRKISWSFSTENRVHYFVILRNVMVMARKLGLNTLDILESDASNLLVNLKLADLLPDSYQFYQQINKLLTNN